uniref:LAGLIDADG endonuclease n=1 Tax=Chrysoporthe deuterocubensis TaxID=764597 RepID=A0A191MWX4_9PEZI|nr:LAGLIDADG endonuclease [Chrysoporthe deuterocubensis]AMX22157.1 LAGLIDADG endonuclease [Chrysoporthe deuterocubensis]
MSKTKYATLTKNVNPHFITGFCDAESSFTLIISKNPRHTLGWSVKLVFNIHLHSKDLDLLYLIQRFFCVGNVTLHGDAAVYQVTKLSDLACIIEHFNNYPLKTQKYADFLLFKQAFDVIYSKEHLTKDGLIKLISLRACLNKGLPERLEVAFPNITPVLRPLVPKTTLESNKSEFNYWMAGFVTGEGCFFVKTSKSKTHKLGISVTLNFIIVQNIRDAFLMESFVDFFGCGSFSIAEKSGIARFTVSNFSKIVDVIIPIFEEYPVLGEKAKDFKDFKEVSVLIKSKAHLNSEGLNKILLIKSNMNFKREL